MTNMSRHELGHEVTDNLEDQDDEQDAGPTVDEISEQAVAAFYKQAWTGAQGPQEMLYGLPPLR